MPMMESRMFPGRFVQVPPPLQNPHLVVTADNVIIMKGNKAIGFLPMLPIELLVLTTSGDDHLRSLIDPAPDHKGEKTPLEVYNALETMGQIGVPPFLRVRMSDGTVQGHEGRHRSAALYRESQRARLWVAIELIDETGHSVYYEEPPYETGKPFPDERRRYLDAGDMPRRFHGQFRDTHVDVDPSELWPIARG